MQWKKMRCMAYIDCSRQTKMVTAILNNRQTNEGTIRLSMMKKKTKENYSNIKYWLHSLVMYNVITF